MQYRKLSKRSKRRPFDGMPYTVHVRQYWRTISGYKQDVCSHWRREPLKGGMAAQLRFF